MYEKMLRSNPEHLCVKRSLTVDSFFSKQLAVDSSSDDSPEIRLHFCPLGAKIKVLPPGGGKRRSSAPH